MRLNWGFYWKDFKKQGLCSLNPTDLKKYYQTFLSPFLFSSVYLPLVIMDLETKILFSYSSCSVLKFWQDCFLCACRCWKAPAEVQFCCGQHGWKKPWCHYQQGSSVLGSLLSQHRGWAKAMWPYRLVLQDSPNSSRWPQHNCNTFLSKVSWFKQ